MFFKVLKSNNKVLLIDDMLTENLSSLNSKEVTSDSLNFDTIKINIENNLLNYIALPACSDKELFYHETNLEIIFSDDLYVVCDCVETINENQSATVFFLNKSYTPSGETLVDKVFRLIPSRIYQIEDGVFSSKKIDFVENSENIISSYNDKESGEVTYRMSFENKNKSQSVPN